MIGTRTARVVAKLIVVMVCVIGGAGSIATAQDCPEIVGRWPYGALSDGAMSGGIGYIIIGSVFQTLDLSDPKEPVLLGELEMPRAGGWVVVLESHAYVVNGGIRVIDVSNPAAPVEVGVLETEWWLSDPMIAGDRMITAAGPGRGYCIIDLRDPASPAVIHRFEIADQFPIGFSATEQHFFVAIWDYMLGSGIRVFDIGHLPDVVEVHFEQIDYLAEISISGSMLFASTYGYGSFVVMDFADPTDPVDLGYFNIDPFLAPISTMVPSGNMVLAVCGSGLVVIDVSDPTDPFIVGELEQPRHSEILAVAGETALVRGSNADVVDLSLPSSPSIVGSHEVFGGVAETVVSGTTAFAATGNGLRVLDLSVPEAPVPVGRLDGSEAAQTLTLRGDIVYLVEVLGGLRIVDVADPANMSVLGSLDGEYMIEWADIELIDDVAYVLGVDGIEVIDIHDASQPTLFGIFEAFNTSSLVTDGFYLFASDASEGLRVFQPTGVGPGLTLVQTLPMGGFAVDLAIKGHLLFVADGDLRVIDVTEPTNPVEVAMVDMPDGAESVTIVGHRAYVRDSLDDLQVVDIGDPLNPVIVGSIEVFDAPFDVDLANGHFVVAEGSAGLTMVRGCQFFYDGFESGDTSGWASTVD